MEFKKGDRVMIRHWDDMAEEYGVDSDGDIIIDASVSYFDSAMRPLCGAQATVKAVGVTSLLLEDWNIPKNVDTDWGFTPQMCILVERTAENDLTDKFSKAIAKFSKALARLRHDDFSKADLRVNDWCVLRNSHVTRVIENEDGRFLVGTGWSGECEFNDDLTHKGTTDLDVIAVHRPEQIYQYIEMQYIDAPIVFQNNDLKEEK